MKRLLALVLAFTIVCLSAFGAGHTTAFAADYFGTAKTAFTKTKATHSTIAVSWNKIPGATGYELQCASDSGFLYHIKDITTTKNEVTLKKLLEKRKHYIRVRAYQDADGQRLYSGWSKTASVKTKDNAKTDQNAEVKNRVKAIVKEVTTKEMTTVEKLFAIQKWMTAYIDYDNSFKAFTTYDAIMNGKGVCESYATSVQAILDEMKIPCKTYRGSVGYNSARFSHAWNVVKVDGKWYIYDVTLCDSSYGDAMTRTMESNGWNYYPAKFLVPYDYKSDNNPSLKEYYHHDLKFPTPAGKSTKYIDWAMEEAKKQILSEIATAYEDQGYKIFFADRLTPELIADIEQKASSKIVIISNWFEKQSVNEAELASSNISSMTLVKEELCSASFYTSAYIYDVKY